MINLNKKTTFQKLNQEFINISEQIEKLKFPKGFLQFILYTLSELFNNIKEHSKAKTVLIQININKKNCLMQISDNGIGLRESYLLKKIYPKDDFAAVEFALSGLSTKDAQERGFGLYSVRKLVENLNGDMMIKSNQAQALISKNQIISKKILKKVQGVGIIIDVPVKAFDFYKIIK